MTVLGMAAIIGGAILVGTLWGRYKPRRKPKQ